MRKELKALIKELNERADELWSKMPENADKTHSLGYMSALEYCSCRIRQILEETT